MDDGDISPRAFGSFAAAGMGAAGAAAAGGVLGAVAAGAAAADREWHLWLGEDVDLLHAPAFCGIDVGLHEDARLSPLAPAVRRVLVQGSQRAGGRAGGCGEVGDSVGGATRVGDAPCCARRTTFLFVTSFLPFIRFSLSFPFCFCL